MTFLAVVSCILGSIGAIAFIVMVAGDTGGGCLSIILCLILICGYIGGNIQIGEKFGTPGVAIFNLVGIIFGIIGVKKIFGWESSSSNSPSYSDYIESRKNSPHTCGNCTKYSSVRGKCRISDNTTSVVDSCSNWC
ncbi:hypothetical protein FACS189494_01150 [Spirochaetia bacterium]|nr:hypothetical protein FACS189494_01150 [Spirochaetia bacterium]